jgi:demethylmenaquinone methyltransferase/2-methoxy-6-polyprenyl-1,4-benzoquinol methylase
MAFSKADLVTLYQKRAENYDISANLYYFIGFREYAFRKKAVQALNLKPGDTVLEIACGTGLNFPLIQKKIGSNGKIIGLDITDKMLEKAQQRITLNGWSNVDLVKSDAAEFSFPKNLNGILSTFAITLIPEYEQIIKDGSKALACGGRFAILDFKKPKNRPAWLTKLLALSMKPFGITLDLADRHPWESIEKHMQKSIFEELYFGFSYLSVGEVNKIR